MANYEEIPVPSIDPHQYEPLDPLHLDIDEDEVVRTVKNNMKSSVAFYTERGLYQRQFKNKLYYLGKQDLYKASNKAKPYKENIIYEALSRQKPIALSRMPDLIVKPGNETPEAKDCSEKLSGIFNSDTKKRSNRKLLGLAFKREPLDFFATIKARWNPEKGKYGDYEYVYVPAENIVFDHNCTDNDANKMRYVAELGKFTLKEVILMFPDKEEEIKKEFGWESKSSDSSDEKMMATMIEIIEVWFHWYKKSEGKTEKIDGVIWIYGNTALKKMRNPYFDYQGRKKLFSKAVEEKQALTVDDFFNMFDSSSGDVQEEIVYNNYFQDPEKPYFFMVYENMGEQPISETSRVEQVLEFQDFINQDGSVIADMNIRSRGKDLFDTNAIPQTTLDSVDLYNIDQALGLDLAPNQSISNVHGRIEQQAATAQQYKSMGENRQKAFEMLAVGPTTRGLQQPDTTLGESQMAREMDFSVNDDIVEDTINALAEWQARWAMQFIKLFYTKPHMRHILGKDGDTLHTKLTQDMVDDGMEVVVSASGVDKMQRKRMAMENMKLGVGDPLTFYEDTEQSNPKERALRAMMAQIAPQMYIQQYLVDKMQNLPPDNPPMPSISPMPQPGEAVPPNQPMGGGNPVRWYPSTYAQRPN